MSANSMFVVVSMSFVRVSPVWFGVVVLIQYLALRFN
jgi:hypothetical protein